MAPALGAKFARNSWWLVIGSFLGLAVSNGPIMTYSLGVLIKPMTASLGWTRAEVTSGLAISGIASAISSPIIGRLMDRFGIKRVAAVCVVLFSISVASVGVFAKSLGVFLLLYIVMGAFSSGIGPLPYAKSIAGRFDRQRGTALGIAIAGVGFGIIVLPPFAQVMISSFNWRFAYIGLGAIHLIVALPIVLFLLREPLETKSTVPSAEKMKWQPRILASRIRQALKGSLAFWFILGIFVLSAAALTGLTTHFVPLLTDSGIPVRTATAVLSTVGLALVAGRVFSGYLTDRIFAPYVTILFLALPLIGILFVGSKFPVAFAFCGAFLIGAGVGAELNTAAFLISRYFDVPSFGFLYGTLTGMFFLSAHLGPFLFDLSYDATGSYKAALIGSGVVLVISSVFASRLGPYVFPVREDAVDAPAPAELGTAGIPTS